MRLNLQQMRPFKSQKTFLVRRNHSPIREEKTDREERAKMHMQKGDVEEGEKKERRRSNR